MSFFKIQPLDLLRLSEKIKVQYVLSPVPSEAAVTRLFSSIRYFIGVQYPELMSKTDHLTSRYWTVIELLIGAKSDRSNGVTWGFIAKPKE